MKNFFFVIFGFIFLSSQLLQAQDTNIPDPNFEQALIDLGIDSDGVVDGNVLTTDINSITDLSLLNREIQDLTGIEGFTALQNLNCSINRLTSINLNSNTALISLNISSNQITALDLSSNTSLEVLNCQDNLLTALDVTANNALINLDFTLNKITGINVSNNNLLQRLKCASNQLSVLNISANAQLTELICGDNQISVLDVGANVLLNTLFCGSNQLTTLDIAQNDALIFLNCSDNQLTALDVSNNPVLKQLTGSSNQITSLMVDQNDSLRSLNVSNNQLDLLDVSGNLVLENLICSSNLLRNIDVSMNPLLISFDVSSNLIDNIDLSPNSNLTSVDCSNNLLEYLNLQNGNNANITVLNASGNEDLNCINVDDPAQIGSLWIKDNPAIYSDNCALQTTLIPDPNFEQALIDQGYDLGPIDGTVITDSISGITVLNISALTISNLSGIGDFSALTNLNCSNNLLTDLDLTKNAALLSIDCSVNLLTSLNIKNNNNVNLGTFDARNNPALLCIAVDDAGQIGPTWQKDAGSSYSDNCNPGSTFIPDDNFEQALIDLGLDVGPLDNYVLTDSISALSSLDISSKNINDLTGIENFIGLDTLDCSSNQLFDLDISQNPNLILLSCFGNYLSSINLSNNLALQSLNIGSNRLSTIDVTLNTALEELIVDSNFLSALDVGLNNALMRLNCNSNTIDETGLDLTNNTNLEELFCANNRFTTIDLLQNTQLFILDISGNLLQGIDLSQNILLTKLESSSNFLTSLDLANNPVVDTLSVNSNLLQNLDLTSNPLLQFLSANNNTLNSIALTNNVNLRALFVNSNELSLLNVGNSPLLNSLRCNENLLSNLDLLANTDLFDLACSGNQLLDLNLINNTNLVSVACNQNNIGALDLSANSALTDLSCSGNQITTLNIGNSTALTQLTADDNLITTLNLSNNPDLVLVSLSGNDITDLDLSLQSQLISLNCSSNLLVSLQINNGNNANLNTFNAINNPELNCIQVDDESMTGSSWQKDGTATYSNNCRYDETFIPDDNFESALASITGEPDNNDDYISTASIAALTQLDVSNQGISDLTGIEDFLLLQTLNISSNTLDSINLSDNTELVSFNASSNIFQTIDLSLNKKLEDINLASNQLNEITLDSIVLVTSLDLSSNQLKELILNNNAGLTLLNTSSNLLTILSVKNGNNSNLITFDATSNPDLICIEIEDVESIGPAWLKDAAASYGENCHYNETFVPDDAFEQALISLGYDYTSGGPLDDYIPTSRISGVKVLNISSRGISDLTGLQDFVDLENLNCSNNDLAAVVLDNNSKLEFLNASGNNLTSIDVSLADSLKILDVSGNLIVSLDVTQNSILEKLYFSSNQLNEIDIRQNPFLNTFIGQVNDLFSVDANSGFNSNLLTFDVRNNPNLTCVLVDDVVASNGYPNWNKDPQAQYKLVCDDDDNDGVADTDDICPATAFGSQVDLFGCPVFSLPTDNFTIKTTSESCRAGNNGKINIVAIEILPYTVTLISELDSVTTYNFGDQVEIRNVRAGRYQLCITVNGQPGYEQCYSLQITQPEDLEVFSSGRQLNGRVYYEMSGNTDYIINFNGREFRTTEDHVSLPLERGKNTIQIKTPLVCQGQYEEVVYVSDEIVAYPNPFDNKLNVMLGNMDSGKITVNIYNASGLLIHSNEYENKLGGIEGINTSELSKGIYLVELIGYKEKSRLKIVKR